MRTPDFPPNESQRLASLRRLQVLDTPAEERLDRITRLAKRLIGTKIALISLVDENRQWFKSAQGLDAPETGRDISFCGHAILGEETFIIENALKDERFFDNPLVTGAPDIRFYAGHPLTTRDGARIGTLCVIDPEPKALDVEELAALRDLAKIAETELGFERMARAEQELRRKLEDAERRASVDSLTRLWNRQAIDALLHQELSRARRNNTTVGVMMLDVDHFKGINDCWGHAVGDVVLRQVAERLRRSARDSDSIGRYGGEEFMMVLGNCDLEVVAHVAERIRAAVCAQPIQTGAGESLEVTLSVGATVWEPGSDEGAAQVLNRADRALYDAKHAGRNRVELLPGVYDARSESRLRTTYVPTSTRQSASK